jgi:hypothetical protein
MILVAWDKHVSMGAQVSILRRASRWETRACNREFSASVRDDR